MIDASELPDNATMLNFDTIEDFEKFVKEQKKYQADNHDTYDPSRSGGPAAGSANGGKPSDYMAAATGIGHIQWRDIVWWQPAGTMNITFNNSYYSSSGYNYFSGVSNINSDNSGISPTDWKKTNSTKNIIDANRTVEIQIAGYYLFGVAVGVFSAGFKDYESFTKYFYRSEI
jgi:hypothetical protein